MPTKAIASASADEPGIGRLNRGHRLAALAGRRCAQIHGGQSSVLVGGVACVCCWDEVILADREFATAHELPILLEVDPSYVDEVAVSRALSGKRVPLSLAERREVLARRAQRRDRKGFLRSFRCAGPAGAR